MRLQFAAALLLLAVPALPQSTVPIQNGSIEGRIVRESKNEPISGVQVTLTPPLPPELQVLQQGTPLPRTPGGPVQILQQGPNGPTVTTLSPDLVAMIDQVNRRPPITAMTDGDGRFSFPNLAPGSYVVRAQKQDYFGRMNAAGAYLPFETKTIVVESGKAARGDLGMVQGGVVRGIVRDPDGEPAPNYAVVSGRPGYTNTGRPVFLLTGARNADDRGEYRWSGFPPGEVYLGVGPRAPGPIANVQDSWARVFYPGVLDPSQARPITIPEGGEVTVNLAAQLRPWNVYKISGVAINPLPNLPADPTTGVVNRAVPSIILMPNKLTPLDNPPSTLWTQLVATNTKPNGEFVLSNVDPGSYELYAMATDGQSRRIWAGHMHVEVTDKDITGLNVPVSPGVTLRGQVVMTGGAALNPQTIRLTLQAMDALPPEIAITVGLITLDQNGNFEVKNLAEGRYRLNVLVSTNGYVAAVQQGGVHVFDSGFTIDTQTSQLPLRVEINPNAEIVEGTVLNGQQQPAPGVAVVLVPAPEHRANSGLYKQVVTDDKGRFRITGVAPGSYTAYAWQAVLPNAYLNSEFLAKYPSRGRTLNVQSANRGDVQLELIQN